jgi:Tol biopolymer transport system component
MKKWSVGKSIFLGIFLIAVISSVGFGSTPPRVIFVRDTDIWMTDLNGMPPVLLVEEGFDPDISPDGTQVAYTDYREGRKIAVYTIETGELQVIDTIPGDNNYGPRWSPDGSRLLFNFWKEVGEQRSYWVIATVRPDGSDFTLLTEEYQESLYSPFWAHDGCSIYAQDLHTLYQFDLSGKIVRSHDMDEVMEIGISSATSFSLSSDGRQLLYDRLVDDPEDLWGIPWMHEPATAVFIYDMEKRTTERISPPGTSFIHPVWVPGEEEVLVYGFTEKDLPKDSDDEIPFHIYRHNLSDQSFIVLVENGIQSSCAMK